MTTAQSVASKLNSPPLILSLGILMFSLLPVFHSWAETSASLLLLKYINALAFVVNVVSVSIPGRNDEREAEKLINYEEITEIPDRTLLTPSGWAFAIWGPIFLGEILFVTSQVFMAPENDKFKDLTLLLPHITAPFVVANLFQCLWCASFRPKYDDGWKKYVSVSMLSGTGYSLSLVHGTIHSSSVVFPLQLLLVPFVLHFGWTTAAPLVNLNRSVSMEKSVSDITVVALGHGSIVLAMILGAGITLKRSSPIYGLTLTWALVACGTGLKNYNGETNSVFVKGAKFQRSLCFFGAAVCFASFVASFFYQ